MPAYFSLDNEISLQGINANITVIEKIISATDTTQFGKDEFKHYNSIKKHTASYMAAVAGKIHASDIDLAERFNLRKDVVKLTKGAEKLLKSPNFAISSKDSGVLKAEIKNAKKLVEFAPSWVIILISIFHSISLNLERQDLTFTGT